MPSSQSVESSRGRDPRRFRPTGAGAVALLALLGLGLGCSRPVARPVDADLLWIGTVERGEVVREVRGPGTLVPEESRWLTAVTKAGVDRILLEAGSRVEPETVILELSKPTVPREVLRVHSPIAGVLLQVAVDQGQDVLPGTRLAWVAKPYPLKAEIRIEGVEVQDLQVGQRARIDTRYGVLAAPVTRIEPDAGTGAAIVEARLEGELPPGVRPQQSVDGTIEIERLPNVLHVGRPWHAERGVTRLFKLSADGKEARLVEVEFGRSSLFWIEVVSGLEVGDRVILSDMSEYTEDSRLRLR